MRREGGKGKLAVLHHAVKKQVTLPKKPGRKDEEKM